MPNRLPSIPGRALIALVAVLVMLLSPLVSPAAKRSDQPTDKPSRAVDVSQSTRDLVQADWVDADRRFAKPDSAKPAATPTVKTAQDALGGNDGVKNGMWGFHVASGEQDPWWQVDLGRQCRLDRVEIYNRCDSRGNRTARLQILVAGGKQQQDEEVEYKQINQHDGTPFGAVVKQP